jgi:hypothetical protein
VCAAFVDAARDGGLLDQAIGGKNIRLAVGPLIWDDLRTLRIALGFGAATCGGPAQQALQLVQEVTKRLHIRAADLEVIKHVVQQQFRQAKRKPGSAA